MNTNLSWYEAVKRKKSLVHFSTQNNPHAQRKTILRVINIPLYFPGIKSKHQKTAVDILPVCEVGVRGVGGATSCVPLGLPELEGIMPRAAGFRPCRNLSSRSLRSLSGSSAALFAPYTEHHIINKAWSQKDHNKKNKKNLRNTTTMWRRLIWHSQIWAYSSQTHSRMKSPAGGKGSWTAVSDKSSQACRQSEGNGKSWGMWQTQLETNKRQI